ncbi:hypothetical protein ACF8O9_10315 [Stenotrophomonas geniculata]|uniref:hypothetical protein n=1 Tax=Stenotrophomonas geniculata TaxID=86188 RepID=UPI003709F81B
MSNDNKTLADVQPGGRVRLGDEAERARFEQCRGGDFERDAQGYYTSPRTAQDWAMWQAALAARQPVGELVAWVHEEDPSRVISASQKATALRDQGASGSSVRPYSVPAYLHVPPAQAVDLGQFRQPVQDWLDDAQASMEAQGDYDGVFGYAIEEGTRLLALIDSQAVGNG